MHTHQVLGFFDYHHVEGPLWVLALLDEAYIQELLNLHGCAYARSPYVSSSKPLACR